MRCGGDWVRYAGEESTLRSGAMALYCRQIGLGIGDVYATPISIRVTPFLLRQPEADHSFSTATVLFPIYFQGWVAYLPRKYILS
jgi:hypothetical protein